MSTDTFDTPPVIGERVSGRSETPQDDGTVFVATWDGLYLGVHTSDWDGEPIHLLVDGQIAGISQRCFGHPAPGLAVTSVLNSTQAVRAYQAGREIVRPEEEQTVYYVNGTNAQGEAASYPDDDWLRDTSADGAPLIDDDDAAIETARCALIESEGWLEVLVYRRYPDGTNMLIAHLNPPTAEPVGEPVREVLVHLNVEVPESDERTADEIAAVIMAALEVGLEGAEEAGALKGVGLVTMALAEEC